MADTTVQSKVESWVRENWMRGEFHRSFERLRLPLTTGGQFSFDAVDQSGEIVAMISTSAAKTSGGKAGVGKLLKIRSDMLFLSMVTAKHKMIVLTQNDMYKLCLKEKELGRVPLEIEFLYVPLPTDLAFQLESARKIASDEVSPIKDE